MTPRTRWRTLAVLVAALALGPACDGSTQVVDPFPDTPRWLSPVGCDFAGERLPAPRVETDVLSLGTFPNALEISDDGELFVVASGDNLVQTGTIAPVRLDGFVDVGADRNPYAIARAGDALYIANFLTSTVSMATLDGTIEREVSVSASPQSLVVWNDWLIVLSSHFGAPEDARDHGTITILDRASGTELGRIETRWANPQFLLLDGDDLVVVESGGTAFDAESGLVTPSSPGGVDAALPGLLGSPDAKAAIALGTAGIVGNPGRPALVERTLWMGSGTAPVLFAVDLDAIEAVYDAERPFRIADRSGNALMTPFAGPGPLLSVLDFNADALHVFEPSCGKPVLESLPLGRNAELLEGPLDLAFDARGDAWIVMSVSGALTRVELPAID